ARNHHPAAPDAPGTAPPACTPPELDPQTPTVPSAFNYAATQTDVYSALPVRQQEPPGSQFPGLQSHHLSQMDIDDHAALPTRASNKSLLFPRSGRSQAVTGDTASGTQVKPNQFANELFDEHYNELASALRRPRLLIPLYLDYEWSPGMQDHLEYTTSFQAPGFMNWHVVHSSGKDRTGVLCMIRSSLISAYRIRTAEVIPGRLLHLRLMFQAPLDLLCTYQHAWNLQNKALRGPDKTDAMLKLRRRVWDQMDKWLSSIPQSHGCAIIGDLNQSVPADPPVSGPGLPVSHSPPHPDQTVLMDILRAHQCCILNTWGRSKSCYANLKLRNTCMIWWHRTYNRPTNHDSTRLDLVRRDLARWRRSGAPAQALFRMWYFTIKLQAHTRALRKACRQKKTDAVAEVVRSSDIYAAAQRFAPKAPRRRLQLRRADGRLQTHEEEFQQITDHFQALYDGPDMATPCLPEDIDVTAEEIQSALQRLRPGKAMPSTSAPAALWKLFGPEVVQSGMYVSCRLQPFVTSFLDSQPQFAYVQGRTLAQSLERVLGCQLSLDISCAYDHVPRWALESALREAQVPESLTQLVLLIHHQATIRIRHFDQETYIKLRRGLRQGCGLASLLWALYSGWLLRRMDDPNLLSVARSATVYADDQHYSWIIRSSSDLEHAYKAIRHVLQQLRQHGLCISVDKTVILLELKGSLAAKLSARYVVHTEQGPHMKFVIGGHTLLIKLVPKHTYLGAIISYHKFESETFRHRLNIAKGSFTRLRVILHNRSVPLKLRLRLWQGCIWPAILHGLDCTGLLPADFQALQSQLIKQARSIAKSFSMFTRESNYDFLKRLKIDDPVRRLRNAIRRRYQQDDQLGPGLTPGPEQLQWRALVSSMLFDTPSTWQTQTKPTPRTQLICVQNVLNEVFTCLECGQQFVTAAALKRHTYCMHMDQRQQDERSKATQQARKHSPMEHSHQGMPQCRHCMYKFTTWHAFFHHVSAKCCAFLRAIYNTDNPEVTILPQLNDALVDSPDIIALARDCSWQDLATLPQAKHPEQDTMIQECIADIKKSNISVANPCQFCGQSYSRRDPRSKIMFGTFSGEIPVPSELREATQELDTLKALLPSLPQTFAMDLEEQEDAQAKQLAELKAIISMLTTLVLRQEIQLSVSRQDTAYVVFIKTQGQDNLAQSLYCIGDQWHQMKQSSPEKLKAPMRAVLFQHFVETIKLRFHQMLASPSSRSQAQELGLISAKDPLIPGLRWDPAAKTHVQEDRIEPLRPEEITASLDRLLILASKEFVVTRFHGMRKLSEEYTSPTLGMFLEIGNRTSEAQEAWELLHKLTQSAAWMAGGCYLRHERLQLSALAKRLALIYAACHVGSLSTVFESGSCQFVRNLIKRSNTTVVHLWSHPMWVALTRGWRRPGDQHDTAEFLQFLCQGSLLVRSSLETAWQARALQGTEWCIKDSGQSALLLLPSPGNVQDDHTCVVTAQRLLSLWQQQPNLHAAIFPAAILVLQVCRFHFEADNHVATKRRYQVIPDSLLALPCFTGIDSQCREVWYQLNSVVIHLGEAPTRGHYQTILQDETCAYLADDGREAKRVSDTFLDSTQRDSYLLIYIRS
ncbi:unnamed protein product, partial [Symbiodinium necroappetens]